MDEVTSDISPQVSVLMSTYNCGQYVADAVQSILGQTFRDFEFLIVDDASTDNTWDVLQSVNDQRIRLWRNEANQRQAWCKNFLLSHVQGEFAAIMDGDDLCDLDRFAQQVNYLSAHPHCGALSSYYITVDSAGRDLQLFPMPECDPVIKSRILRSCNGFLNGGAMIRSALLREAGGYRFQLGIGEDNDLWLRLADRCEFANLPRALYRWRQHTHNSTRSRGQTQGALVMVRLLALERKHCGADSLARYSDQELARLRQGRILMPRVGDTTTQRRVLRELCGVLISGAEPAQSLRVAAATVRRWPLHWLGYAMAARTMLNPRSYLRQFRIMRNYVGMLAYSLLGLNRDRGSG